MRFKSATLLTALALLTLAAAHAQTQQQGQKDEPQQKDEKVIDDFVTTRGIIFDAPAPAKPKQSTRRRPSSGVASTKKSTPSGAKQGGAAVGAADVAQQKNEPAEAPPASTETPAGAADGAQFIKASSGAPRSLALGYTIYMKDASGALLPVPASKSYRTGDTIVMVLETNMDGYLYVFNAENGKNPVMLYPDVRLNDGANDVRAHVRETYPSDPGLGFDFVEPAATEHFFIVVSREPLVGVPTGDALKKFCGKNIEDCEWRPTAALWARISAAALDRRVVEARGTQIAQAETQPVMPAMLQRGIKLKREEPAPSILRVSDSPAARMLVTKIELTHN
jgi:hypothetical protein